MKDEGIYLQEFWLQEGTAFVTVLSNGGLSMQIDERGTINLSPEEMKSLCELYLGANKA